MMTLSISGHAQNLLDALEKEYPDTPQYEMATFKTTRIALGHSIENRKKGVLEIRTTNRFWNLPNNQDSQSFFVDKVSSRIALEYGVSDRMTIGVGGTTFDGVFDGFLKYKLIRQRSDAKGSPLSVTLFQGGSYRSKRFGNINAFDEFYDKVALTSQVLIAHKFNPKFSVQLAPTFIHRGSTVFEEDPENQFALGIAARHKIGGHASIISEYYHVMNPLESIDTYNAFALGVNWELSDVMLQFYMTNARSTVEDAFITQTTNNFNFKDGNFHFGFNATFILHLKNKKLK
ncbi:DUF5777 family beta-barrel protein [Aquimarina pacifica]|uniref:DUF5777 family beta-barrel protein n=1 Tax=Aquimarina pacifica TaxID=1296415 RepID=UPI001F4D3323|nr:DUF5777 family beta-barrel protein [Aquimarina pacifica]